MSLAAKGIERCEFKIRFFGLSEPALRKLAFLASIGLASTDPRTVGEAEGWSPAGFWSTSSRRRRRPLRSTPGSRT